MIARLVSFALRQPFVIVVASLALMAWGAWSFQKLPIDAYPDLSPPHVVIISQWPGHAAEEIERLITIPLEIEMNGIPQLESLRSQMADDKVIDLMIREANVSPAKVEAKKAEGTPRAFEAQG